jgi:aerobic-type carbon monoxide dehydrogenase small subunit (CoxS/CutS family)
MSRVPLKLKVNNEELELLVEPHWTLLEVLREELDLTGTKEGCGEGVCGACTVLLDGKPVRACLTLALEAQGCSVTTVEGLAGEKGLDPLQDSFIRHGAVQCGFCTPGMIMAAKALLLENPCPQEEDIRKAISGNICRCTGYAKIVEAIAAVASQHDPAAKGSVGTLEEEPA